MTLRPKRRYVSLSRIARWHDLGDMPYCVKCEYCEGTTWQSAQGWLERAHIIDRTYGGLDIEPNLLPLCAHCHRHQPAFKNGEEAEALAWFKTVGDPVLAFILRYLAEYPDEEADRATTAAIQALRRGVTIQSLLSPSSGPPSP